MIDFAVKGWCPGALRPMESGDGLVVRIRPRLAELAPYQMRGIAAAALRHGNGVIELTARANDEGWDTTFAAWLHGSRLDSDDAVLVFSVGGGNAEKKVSTNIVAALRASLFAVLAAKERCPRLAPLRFLQARLREGGIQVPGYHLM